MITSIPIERLRPHRDNPRKNLGDLTELAQSIKAKGVLQNLTVVPQEPGFCPSCNLYLPSAGKCKADHDLFERPPCSQWQSAGNFTVIIGHRRLAAAKLAGLTELPCAVTEMSDKDQVATMLLENMQRSDLTVYEQARGIQMMMNLGDTISGISEKTGFSENTVRRRVKLLELNAETFKKSVERGATLMDFAKLEQIKDITRRNEVLESIGTPSFDYKLKSALEAQKADEYRPLWIEALSRFASEVPDGIQTWHVCSYSPWDDPGKKLQVPDDADTVEYYYRIGTYNISLTKKHTLSEAEQAAERKRNAMRERDTELHTLAKRAYELRRDFVLNFHATKKHLPAITQFWLKGKVLRTDSWNQFNNTLFAQAMGIVDEKGDYKLTYSAIEGTIESSPECAFLVAAYCDLYDGERKSYHSAVWGEWPKYAASKLLDIIYEGLEELGYQVSDEERKWMTGTHELFTPPEEDSPAQSETEETKE